MYSKEMNAGPPELPKRSRQTRMREETAMEIKTDTMTRINQEALEKIWRATQVNPDWRTLNANNVARLRRSLSNATTGAGVELREWIDANPAVIESAITEKW